MTAKTVAHPVRDAKSNIENLSPDQVAAEVAAGKALLVEVRDAPEPSANGAIPGAVHASRGMLEFYADPSSPYHKAEFDPGKRLILHCASGGRRRSRCSPSRRWATRTSRTSTAASRPGRPRANRSKAE